MSDTGIKLFLAGSAKDIIHVFSILQQKIGKLLTKFKGSKLVSPAQGEGRLQSTK